MSIHISAQEYQQQQGWAAKRAKSLHDGFEGLAATMIKDHFAGITDGSEFFPKGSDDFERRTLRTSGNVTGSVDIDPATHGAASGSIQQWGVVPSARYDKSATADGSVVYTLHDHSSVYDAQTRAVFSSDGSVTVDSHAVHKNVPVTLTYDDGQITDVTPRDR